MPKTADEQLKSRIMRRVYATWFLKQVAPMLAVEGILLAGVAVGVLTHISVSHIFANAFGASGNALAFADFFIRNFFVKSIQSQLLLGAYAVVAAFFVRDFRRAIIRLRRIAQDGSSAAFAMSRNQH